METKAATRNWSSCDGLNAVDESTAAAASSNNIIDSCTSTSKSKREDCSMNNSIKKFKTDTTSDSYAKDDKVYASYWPQDADRGTTNPSWHPGTIKGYYTSKGGKRLYNVVFDDGDTIHDLENGDIMTKNQYIKKVKKEIKPLFDKGDEVYAAYWPGDNRIASTPTWYPGKIKNYHVEKGSGCGEYGPTRFYDVEFDDGDKIDGLEDAYIFNKEDYLLTTRIGTSERKDWIGVKNVVDEGSSDLWANLVGWYTTDINGEELPFSLLSDALRAYDDHVMQSSMHKIKKSQVNLPEECDFSAGGSPRKHPKSKSKTKKEYRRRVVSPRINTAVMKKIQVGSRIYVEWPKDGKHYKATVKKLCGLEKEPPLVKVHFDGRKKQSFEDVHPGLISDFIDGENENISADHWVAAHPTETIKERKGKNSLDRNDKIKMIHAAVVQKLESKVTDLELMVEDLTTQKEYATSKYSKLKLKDKALSRQLKEAETKLTVADTKGVQSDVTINTLQHLDANVKALTIELENTKADLFAAQERAAEYQIIAKSSEGHVQKTYAEFASYKQQTDAQLKKQCDNIITLEEDLASSHNENEKAVKRLRKRIDSLEDQLIDESIKAQYVKSKKAQETKKRHRVDSDNLQEIKVKVKVDDLIGDSLAALVPGSSHTTAYTADRVKTLSYSALEKEFNLIQAELHKRQGCNTLQPSPDQVHKTATTVCEIAAMEFVDSMVIDPQIPALPPLAMNPLVSTDDQPPALLATASALPRMLPLPDMHLPTIHRNRWKGQPSTSHKDEVHQPMIPPGMIPMPPVPIPIPGHHPAASGCWFPAPPSQVPLPPPSTSEVPATQHSSNAVAASRAAPTLPPPALEDPALPSTLLDPGVDDNTQIEPSVESIAEILNAMPFNVRKAAENNQNLVAQLIVERQKKKAHATKDQSTRESSNAATASPTAYDSGSQH